MLCCLLIICYLNIGLKPRQIFRSILFLKLAIGKDSTEQK